MRSYRLTLAVTDLQGRPCRRHFFDPVASTDSSSNGGPGFEHLGRCCPDFEEGEAADHCMISPKRERLVKMRRGTVVRISNSPNKGGHDSLGTKGYRLFKSQQMFNFDCRVQTTVRTDYRHFCQDS